jgi:polysaccharide biosynthesis/export protein
MKLTIKHAFIFLLLSVYLSSCKIYDSSIMFKTDTTIWGDSSLIMKYQNSENYVLQPNDEIELTVTTSKGEILVDPNMQFRREMGLMMIGGTQKEDYLILGDGTVRLPMVGFVKLSGLTIMQVDTLLSTKFNEFYNDVFVKTKLGNRRVFILSGKNQSRVIPLAFENMNLLEVLALGGGVDVDSRATNIRIVRGDLKNPTIIVVNLSKREEIIKTDLRIYPGDIIYIEPVRKKAVLITSDISAVMSPIFGITSLATSLFLLFFVNNR